MLAVFQR